LVLVIASFTGHDWRCCTGLVLTPPSNGFERGVISSDQTQLVPAPVELLLRLRSNANSVPHARHVVGQFCRDGRLTSLAHDVELLTTELMTNACRHSEGLITLIAHRDMDHIVVTVTDDNPRRLPSIAAPDPLDDTGRGLFLVDQVAGEWGVKPHPRGKSVWFQLP
jgi:anti-sigma regulatory factor (Ser/Thr protein kinase)